MSNITKEAGLTDLEAGQTFGHLTVLQRVGGYCSCNGRDSQRYLCECECGNTVVLSRSVLLNGKRKSCGCRFPATLPNRANAKITQSSVYAQWNKIKKCPHDPAWDSFQVFKEWSIKHGCVPHARLIHQGDSDFWGPKTCLWLSGQALKEHQESISRAKRIRSSRAYWAKVKEMQAGKDSRKRNAKIPYKDQYALPVRGWADILGIPAVTLYKRLAVAQSGTLEEALQTPYKDRDLIQELDSCIEHHPDLFVLPSKEQKEEGDELWEEK